MSGGAPPSASGAIHATAIVVGECGILIRGPSGSGKSSLALAILRIADERGSHCRLIGDDRVVVEARSARALARCSDGIKGLVEWRGLGIVPAPCEPAAVIRLVVDLESAAGLPARLPDAGEIRVRIAGVELPRLAFAPSSGTVERAYATLDRLARMATGK